MVGLDSTPVDPTEEAEGPPALARFSGCSLTNPWLWVQKGALEMDWGTTERKEAERLLQFSKGQRSNEMVKNHQSRSFAPARIYGKLHCSRLFVCMCVCVCEREREPREIRAKFSQFVQYV